MELFVIRTFQDSKTVFIGDSVNTIQLDIKVFNQFEPDFLLGENIRQIEYHKNSFWQIIHGNGEFENRDPKCEEYNGYISKVKTYIDLKQKIDNVSTKTELPASLAAAKQKIAIEIYQYTASKLEESVSYYSSAERDRWSSTILPEAESYLATNDMGNSPNLVAQQIVRSGITDTSSQEFKNSLIGLCNTVISKNNLLTQRSNYLIGIRGRWTDAINSFVQSEGETEKESIERLLQLDWKIDWDKTE